MRRALLVVLTALTLAGAGLAAGPAREPVARAASKRSASDAMRDANTRLRAMLAKEKPNQPPSPQTAQAVTRELRDLFDIGLLTRRALVDHWAKMTPAQQTAIVDTLREIVERNYISQLRSNLEYKIDYVGEEKAGDEVIVRTVIRAKKNGRPTKIHVDYRLVAVADGWRVYDVITEDVSILDNYRSQFNRIIAKDGVDGLITRMKAKLGKGGE